MNEFFYFCSPVYREEHPEWAEFTVEKCDKYFKWTEENTQPSLIVQTPNLAIDPDLKFLADHYQKSCIEILTRQGYDVAKYDFFISGMWGQDVKCYGGHVIHVHKNTLMSGFYFMDTHEGGAYPVFEDPRAGKMMAELDLVQGDELQIGSAMVHFNNMLPGTFMYFPSWLPHRIVPSASDKPCKFIHFTLSHRDKNQCNII